MNALDACIKTILNDIRVELLDEFDKNFQRGSFFGSAKWPKSARPGAKSPLIDSGNLRRSIRGTVSGHTVAFSSSLPYASIHNTGGILTVTTKMKRYFWAKYIEATGKTTKTKSGQTANTKRNRTLSAAAQFYKAMALKKTGSKIKIPQRQFLGHHRSLEQPVKDIIGRNLEALIRDTLPDNSR